MNEDRYEQTIDELEPRACKWWPKEVRDEAQEISVLQTLLDSQERSYFLWRPTSLMRSTTTSKVVRV